MTADLWTEASVDVEAEHRALRQTRAKVAVASFWPFLALAQTAGEFEHRLALIDEHLIERVAADLIGDVVASLREDFRILASSDADAAGEPDSGAEDEDGSAGGGGGDDSEKPAWLQDKINSTSSLVATAYYDQGLGRWVKVALDDDANSGAGNPWYFTGGPEAGPMTGETTQYPTFPVGNLGDPVSPVQAMFPMQPSPWTVPPGGEWRENPMNFSPPNGGQRMAKVSVGDTDVCRDCRNPVKAVKVSWGTGIDWTHTGKHGAMADDDHPVQPERLTRNAAQRVATEGIVPTPGPNPNYFAGGAEGAAGQQGAGFPEDVTLPEDTENLVNDLYGTVPPQVSSGTAARRYAADIGPINRAPDSDPNLGTQFASPEEAERYRKGWSGEQPGNRDSTATTGARHGFYDPTDRGVWMVAADDNLLGNISQGIENFAKDPSQAMSDFFNKGPIGGNGSGWGGGGGGGAGDGGGAAPAAAPAATNAFGDQGQAIGDQMGKQGFQRRADQSSDPSGDGGTPDTPPSMTPGNPGAVASTPMDPGATSTPSNIAPSTTRPRQMPGGGGQAMARRVVADGDTMQRPTSENPYGTDDPFDAKTWENAANQRVRIPMDHMNFNGPQNPNARERIRTTNSEPGAHQEREQEDED